MAVEKWSTPTSIATVLSTELNAIAAAGNTAASAVIDQDASRDVYAAFELAVTYATGPAAGAFVTLYLLPTLDGTNYPDGDATIDPPPNLLAATFPIRSVATAQRVVVRDVVLPSSDFKVVCTNEASTAFSASGHTLKMIRYDRESS